MRFSCCVPHFPSLCPPFAQLNDLWYWMWLVLSYLSLCGTKLIKKFSPLQLDSLSSCHPKWLRRTGVGRWEGGDGEPDWKHHRCGDLDQMVWGDRKQRLSRMLYLRGARASLLISVNIYQVPEGKSLLSFSSLKLWLLVLSLVDETETLLGTFRYWQPNVFSQPLCTGPLSSKLLLLETLLPAPSPPSSPTKQDSRTFLLRLSSNAAASEKSSPEFTPFFALPPWASHQVQVSHSVHLVSSSCVSLGPALQLTHLGISPGKALLHSPCWINEWDAFIMHSYPFIFHYSPLFRVFSGSRAGHGALNKNTLPKLKKFLIQ